jgi:hypothetical protein
MTQGGVTPAVIAIPKESLLKIVFYSRLPVFFARETIFFKSNGVPEGKSVSGVSTSLLVI